MSYINTGVIQLSLIFILETHIDNENNYLLGEHRCTSDIHDKQQLYWFFEFHFRIKEDYIQYNVE